MKEMKTSKVIVGIIGAILILILSQVTAQLLSSLFVMIHIPVFICNIAAGILYVLFACYLLKQFAEKALKLTLSDLGIPRFKIEVKWILIAFILPLYVMGVYFFVPGTLQKNNMNLIEMVELLCAGVFFTGLAAGIIEEMVFRGFIMHLLDKKIGRKAAVFIPSLLFGLVHIIGMDFSLFSCLQVIIAGMFVGIMFSVIALERHSIWNSAIVHAIWNVVILGGFLSIGTKIDEYSAYTYVLKTNSFALTGGEFGIEASVIAMLGYVVVTLIVYLNTRKLNKV